MKNNLMTGDILSCTSNGILGKTIKKLTKSKYNHTAIVIVISGETFIVEAQANGINIKTYDNWINKYNYQYVTHRYINHNEQYGSFIRKRVISKIGITGYDVASLAIFQPIYLLTNKWIGRTKESAENKFYCSELAAWVIGIEEFWKYNPDMVYKYLENNLHWQKIISISDTLSAK